MLIDTMARAYSYVRFSTPEQSKGDSLRRQLELSTAYAEKHGLILDDSLTLRDEGLSGFTGENRKKGALAVFIRAVETGLVKRGSYLLIESLDRLSRDTLSEQMTLFMMLVNSGITIVTLADQQEYSKQTINNDISRLMISLVSMMRAHEESVMKSQRVRAAWDKKRRDIGKIKLSAQCPAWLELIEDRTGFLIIEERADIIRRIYQMNIGGVGQMQIARTLNGEGIKSWGGDNGWHPSYVQRILQTRAVLGEFQPLKRDAKGKSIPAGEPVVNYYPSVIDISTWQKAQERRQTSTPGRVSQSNGNLFTGIIFDGYNGCSMRHMSRPGTKATPDKPAQRWYYLVSDYGRLKKGQQSSSWRYDWFEKWFLDYLIRIDWSVIAAEEKSAADLELETQLAARREALSGIQGKLKRLAEFISSSDRTPKTILSEITTLEDEEGRTRSALITLEKRAKNASLRRAAMTESANKIRRLVDDGDGDSRLRLREEIRRRIQRVDVFPDGARKQDLQGEPVQAPDSPAFKVTFTNGAYRWVFCTGRKPIGDAAVLDTYNIEQEDFALAEVAEVQYGTGKPGKKLVPVPVPLQETAAKLKPRKKMPAATRRRRR